MRLATWNVERLPSAPRRVRVAAAVRAIGADLWVFTETDTSLLPDYRYQLHASEPDPERRPEERWVAIASRLPLTPLELTGDPGRSAAARLTDEGHEIVVFGSFLPWPADHWHGLRGTAAFRAALDAQFSDLCRLRTGHPDAELILAGDLNQDLADGSYFWSPRNRRRLEAACAYLELVPLTADPTDPVRAAAPNRRSIDHLCTTHPDRWDRTTVRAWPESPIPDRRLSDHYGAVIDAAAVKRHRRSPDPIKGQARKAKSWFTPEQVRAWVERTCAEQGVPVRVTDPVVLAQVDAILREARAERARRAASSRLRGQATERVT